MSEIEILLCPGCGQNVQTMGGPTAMVVDSKSGTTVRSLEQVFCPHCEKELEREIRPGAPWRASVQG
jgi:endogenous inhibitor of DNA gyrase (YacG/DUF329 family)